MKRIALVTVLLAFVIVVVPLSAEADFQGAWVDGKKIFSVYDSLTIPGIGFDELTIGMVPAKNNLIITDIAVFTNKQDRIWIEVYRVGGTIEFGFYIPTTSPEGKYHTLNLSSGIVFFPGDEVVLQGTSLASQGTETSAQVLVSGYLVKIK